MALAVEVCSINSGLTTLADVVTSVFGFHFKRSLNFNLGIVFASKDWVLIAVMGKCNFKSHWEEDDRFKDWVSRGKDKHHVVCSACRRELNLGTSGTANLLKHSRTMRHKVAMRRVASEGRERAAFTLAFAPPAAESSGSHRSQAQGQSQKQPQPSTSVSTQDSVTLVSKDTMKAEVLWTLRTIVHHQSYSSNADIGEVFALMFPDSEIAKAFKCGEDKSSYLAKFGLAPYFTKLIEDEIRKVGTYVLMFDESLCNVTGEKQLDLHIRYWTATEGVASRYLTSRFLGHAKATDLQENILVKLIFIFSIL